MATKKGTDSALPPIRVLDLTEGGCMLGGKMLADMGADVIKIEPPGGSASRIQPYYKNLKDPEKSLFWFAYNTNKRGVTLNLDKPKGQEIFKKLARTADIILESASPGYMAGLKLGYADICKIKPDIIYAAITPFGQDGPKSNHKSSDLTIVASSGFLNACGDPDRAPVWIGFPQASFYAGAEAAIGAMTAYWYRLDSGEGQFVDVSGQEANMSANMNSLPMWDVNKVEFNRVGAVSYVAATRVRQPIYFRCKDGYVMILALGGNPPYVPSSEKLVKWMDEEGMAPDWLKKLNWQVDYNAAVLKQELADKVGKAIETFTLTKTKDQLYEEGAFGRQILVAPVSSTKNISEDIQLKARNYWTNIYHPELKTDVPYGGQFVPMSETPIQFKRRAPLIGEHNKEIYVQELHLAEDGLIAMKNTGII
jgi:crotonobetainyl-CoA:carnitine CoA-transferase CaiB-like acyl-CoA transferase